MSTDAKRGRAHGPLLRRQVVALCEDQDEAIITSSLDLGRSWDFVANRSSSVIQYTLSISITRDVVVYIRFTSHDVTSLKKLVHNRKESSRCLDISRHLDNHQVFTSIQFQLSRNRDVITPKEFDPSRHESRAQTTFQVVAMLSTVSNFSLYMPVDSLPKAIYQELYEDYRQHFRSADIRSMYNGKGGSKFDVAQYRSGVATDQCLPPSHKTNKRSASPVPASQQSTASEVSTVAATTPPAYKNDGQKVNDDLAPPPYYDGKTRLSSSSEDCLKHNLSDDDADVNLQPEKRSRVADTSVSTASHEIHVLKAIIDQQKAVIQQLMEKVDALDGRVGHIEEAQELVDDRLDSLDVQVHEVGTDVNAVELKCDAFTTELSDIRQESEQWTGAVDEYIECAKESVMFDMVEHGKSCIDQYAKSKHTEMHRASDIKNDLKRILKDVLDHQDINATTG
ncbi:hypothetical protein BJ166DRAFT_329343 [Pestalotiopsis sp. NC0098]|nr:hypothetical protein BJ166DRAFT_329343 [Pestalotiopsis sp. NC0098]